MANGDKQATGGQFQQSGDLPISINELLTDEDFLLVRRCR
jgi:hypothetical protein